jgi:hypothetical protein
VVSTDRQKAYNAALITVSVAPETGYRLTPGSLVYVVEGVAPVPITTIGSLPNTYTFAMPTSDVVVEASFEPIEEGGWDGTTIDVSWYDAAEVEFHLSTPEELMGLAAIVNGIYNKDITTVIGDDENTKIVANVEGEAPPQGDSQSTSAYHFGADDFNGKIVYLDADIDMGGVANFMPIGGQYLMEPNDYSTKLSSSFNGTFDGQGHWVTNIYASRQCTTENFGDGTSIALIGRLGCHDGDPQSIWPDSPAVRNVAVSGYVRGNRSVGGIVGKIGKTKAGGIIENCANFATVVATDAKGTGGIVGASWNGGVLRNCFNVGDVTGGWPAGGISGSNEIAIENCYSIGTIASDAGNRYTQAIGTDNGGALWGYAVNNCWYLEGSAPNGGYYNGSSSAVSGVVNDGALSAEEMKAASFIETLNAGGDAFVSDLEGEAALNGGYPILSWMATNAPLEPGPSVGEAASGDLDGDGVVTVAEALTAAHAVVSGIAAVELNDAQVAALDMDSDGHITMADVVSILRKAVGL